MEKTLHEKISDLQDRREQTVKQINGNEVAKSKAEMRIVTLNTELKEINQTIKFFEREINRVAEEESSND